MAKYPTGVILVHFPENGHHGCDKHCPFCHFSKIDYNIPIMPTDEEILDFLSNLADRCVIQICGAGDPLYHFDKNKDYLLHVIDLLHENRHPVQIVTKYPEVVQKFLPELSRIEFFSFSSETQDGALRDLISDLMQNGAYVRITKIANFTSDIHDIDRDGLEKYAAFYSDIKNKDKLSISFRPNFNFEYDDSEVDKERRSIWKWSQKYGCRIYMHPQGKRIGNPQLWNGRIVRCGDTVKYADLDMETEER